MKKKITILVLMILIIISLTGCTMKEEEKESTEEEVKWNISDDSSSYNISYDEMNVFENYEGDLKPVVLLADKDDIDAYLVKETKDKNKSWKIAFVDNVNDFTVKSVNNLDLDNYLNRNISIDYISSSYGWNYKKFKEESTMNEDVRKYYDNAMEKFAGNSYTPIIYLGNSDKDYLVFCYETNSIYDSSNKFNGYAILTIHVQDDNAEITSIANIDLHNYEK